jgi:hypothetical protein
MIVVALADGSSTAWIEFVVGFGEDPFESVRDGRKKKRVSGSAA